MNDIAPGWYKDPAEPTTQRYWDGEGWIGESLPIDATPPSSPPDVAPRTVTLPSGPATAAGTGQGGPPWAGQGGADRPERGAAAGSARGGTPAGLAGPGPGIGAQPPAPPAWPTPPPPASVPPASAPPGSTPPASAPPGSTPPASAPPVSAPPGSAPPGAWPPGGPPAPPGAWPPGAWAPGGPPPPLPPGAPPGSIPWPTGSPPPPGYRLAYTPVQPRPHGLPVASLGLRFLARLIDFGIVLGLSAVATGWLVYLFISDYAPLIDAMAHGQDELPAVPSRAGALYWVIPLVAMVVWLAYEVPATARGGQTVGKRAVGIKVMALESEQPLGGPRALRRWVPLGLPMLLWTCGLGFILQLMDSISPAWGGPMHLAMHDRSAQTVVVQVGRRGHEITPVKAAKTTGEQS